MPETVHSLRTGKQSGVVGLALGAPDTIPCRKVASEVVSSTFFYRHSLSGLMGENGGRSGTSTRGVLQVVHALDVHIGARL